MIQVTFTEDEARALMANCVFAEVGFEAMGVKSEYPQGSSPKETAVAKLAEGLILLHAAHQAWTS